MGRTGFGGQINEPSRLTTGNSVPFVVLISQKDTRRLDGRPGTNKWKKLGLLFSKRTKDDGRGSGRTHPYIGCASVRPFSPFPWAAKSYVVRPPPSVQT